MLVTATSVVCRLQHGGTDRTGHKTLRVECCFEDKKRNVPTEYMCACVHDDDLDFFLDQADIQKYST